MLLRRSGKESVNFVAVYFSFALNEEYKFHVFFSSNFSSFIFTLKRNEVLYLALINRYGELKVYCN